MTGSSKKIFSGVAWSIVTNVVNAVYGFIMIPILISYFGKAEYGLIGLAQSVNAYMRLMDLGLTSTNVRFFSNWITKGDEIKVNKLFATCTSFYGIVGLINALVLVVVSFFSDSIFNVTPEQNVILQKLLIILAISAIVNWFTSCYTQIIQATENVAWTQKRILVTKLLMVVAIIATVYLKLSITAYVALTVLCNWVILPWVVRKIKSLLPFISFRPRFDKAVFKEILPYTLNIFSFTFFSFSYNNLKPVFLGIQSTPESVTDYKVIMGIVGLVSAISSVFMSTMLPSSSKAIARNDKDAFYHIAYQGTKYLMLYMGLLVFGMLTVGKDLLVLYVGEEYLYLTQWLYLFVFLLLSNHVTCISSLILGGSDIRPLSRMTAVSSIFGLLATWFLIPKYEVGGVAIATAVYTIGQQLFYYLYYWPKILQIDSWKIFRTMVVPVSVFGTIIWLAVILIPHFANRWANVLVFGALFVVLYGFFALFYLNKEDKKYLVGLVKRS